jgi:MoxR-like ATPase
MTAQHETPPAVDTADVRARMARNRAALSGPGGLVGREREIESLFTAPLCAQHVLLVGPPGTGKSYLSRAALSQFNGASVYWEGLLTRQTVEDQVMGHLDVPAFQQGKMTYVMAGHAPAAHFAFVDEAFKATGGLLNAKLSWLNERVVMRGTLRYTSPLVTCVGASNEFGEDESTEALEDRFLFRHWVDAIAARADKVRFLQSKGARAALPQLEPVSLPELQACQAEAAALPVEASVYSILADLQDTLRGVGVAVSDRRLGQCIDVLRAYAWLCGDSEVGPEHVEILRNVLWHRPEEIPAVEAAIGAVDKGMMGEIRGLVEQALEPYHRLRAECDEQGHWKSEGARAAYLAECVALQQRFQQTGMEIKSRFANVPARVQARAREYLKELQAAFEQCRDDAKLGV